MKKVCKICGKEFEPINAQAYKRNFCYDDHYYKCDNCGKDFKLSEQKCQQHIKNPNRRFFCSLSCASKYGNSHRDINKVIEKMNKTCMQKYGVIGYNNREKFRETEQREDIWTKSHQTKKLRGSYGKSKQEDILFNYIKNNTQYNIERQVIVNNVTYDFKVNNILIEFNGDYYHNYRPFTNTKEDLEEYYNMKQLGGQKSTIADTWKYRDVEKLNYCIANNIKLLVIYFDKVDIKLCEYVINKLNTLSQVNIIIYKNNDIVFDNIITKTTNVTVPKTKFEQKYSNIVPQIKQLYENTPTPKNKIAKQFNMDIKTLNKIINIFNLQRDTKLISEMYSNKSKQQFNQLQQSDKYEQYKQKQSNITKNYWESLDDNEYNKRIQNYFPNKSQEEQIDIINKMLNTTKQNYTYNTSSIEDKLYVELVKEFGKENVIRQYTLDKFVFDFKITRHSTNPKSKDTIIEQLIELHGSYYHNYRPYIVCEEHNLEYTDMINKGGQKAKIANKWMYTDVDKFNYCKRHKLNYTAIYFDTEPKPYFTNQQLISCYNKICDQKLGYTNVSKHNEIVDNFCYKEIYKDNIQKFKEDSIYKYLVNRIKYANNYGEGCHNIDMLKLIKDFNKSGNILKSYTMYPSVNIQTFITKYNIKSIGDPFAGWGQRMLGSITYNCKYTGCDINKHQITNLNDILIFIKSNGIKIPDVTLYSQDSLNVDLSHSDYTAIFTCPPYYNIEKYTSNGIENLSYNEFKLKFVQIIKHWITNNVKIVCIQFTNKYEDCIDALGYNYIKIDITKTNHHFNKNKKHKEYLYIMYI